jgi:hypothetical protein
MAVSALKYVDLIEVEGVATKKGDTVEVHYARGLIEFDRGMVWGTCSVVRPTSSSRQESRPALQAIL